MEPQSIEEVYLYRPVAAENKWMKEFVTVPYCFHVLKCICLAIVENKQVVVLMHQIATTILYENEL